MPKVTITFNLPEESHEHHDAIHGADWKSIVYELTNYLRGKRKYGHSYKSADEALDDIWETLWNECKENNLDPWQ